MKCFNCGRLKMRTIYPVDGKDKFVQKVCDTCGYKSYPVKIPIAIDVQACSSTQGEI